jgi:hypothetical protein
MMMSFIRFLMVGSFYIPPPPVPRIQALREVRGLAKLENLHVIRYHSAWLEYAYAPGQYQYRTGPPNAMPMLYIESG